MKKIKLGLAVALGMSLMAGAAAAAEKMTYLFPAPDFLPPSRRFSWQRPRGITKPLVSTLRFRSARAERMSPSRSPSVTPIWAAESEIRR